MAFTRLVRFRTEGSSKYGDLIESSKDGYLVQELDGNIEQGFTIKSSNPVHVDSVRKTLFREFLERSALLISFATPKLLCPLECTPIIYCIGLNYRSHAEEMKVWPT